MRHRRPPLGRLFVPKKRILPHSFRIEELVLVSSSFSHRADFLTRDRRSPIDDHVVDAQFQLVHGLAPSVVGVTVRVATRDGVDGAYAFHAEMMAIIRVEDTRSGVPADSQLLQAGVTILFPFVRETIANMTMRGRFGATWIKPMNVQSILGAAPSPAQAPRAGSESRKKARARR